VRFRVRRSSSGSGLSSPAEPGSPVPEELGAPTITSEEPGCPKAPGNGDSPGRLGSRSERLSGELSGCLQTTSQPANVRWCFHAKGITRSARARPCKRSRQTGAGPLWDATPIRALRSRTWPRRDYRSWPQGRPTPSAKAIARRWLSASSCITTAQPGRTNRPPRPARPLLPWHCSDAVTRRRAIAFTSRSLGDGGCGTGPLARYRLAPRRGEITFGRHCDSAVFAPLDPNAIVAPAGAA
jgi:hypothetical protein